MFLFRRRCEFILFTVLVLFTACKSPENSEAHYASLNDSTRHVGIASCRNCHEDKYQTYIHTGMGLSFDYATRQKSSGVFGPHEIVYDSFRNLNYHPFWRNDSMYIDEFRISGNDTVYKRTEAVTWVVGSGQHTNSHLTRVNGYIYQAPLTFYTQNKQWDLPPGYENGFNSRFSRQIGLECMTCHNAYPVIVAGSENKYDFVANGIDCERCHGPGSKHVEEKMKGIVVDVNKKVDYSIVNPSKLPIDLQLDVCQRCHIQGNAVLQPGKSFLDFRPAMRLSDVMDVYMPVFQGENNEHIMASHAERMKMSRCYTASLDSADIYAKQHETLKPYKNAMTCITCHDPHVSVRTHDPAYFNSKCKNCHHAGTRNHETNPALTAKLCTESTDKRKLVNDNCISCHMPRNGTIDIPHVTNTDHWIRLPVKKDAVNKARVFAGLDCINNNQPSRRSKGNAFLSYFEKFSSNPAYLDSAAKYFINEDPNSFSTDLESQIRLAFLRQNYKLVINYAESANAIQALKTNSVTNDHAWSNYRIGESYYSVGDLTSAIRYYQQSVQLAPFIPDFRNKLAGAQQDAGMNKEAAANYEFIINENPRYTKAYINYGFLLLTAFNNVQKANTMYDQALLLDPDNIQGLLNKAGLLLFTGKKEQSKIYLRKVLKLDKANMTAQKLLKQI